MEQAWKVHCGGTGSPPLKPFYRIRMCTAGAAQNAPSGYNWFTELASRRVGHVWAWFRWGPG
jgi:hypothetical protein